MRRSGFTLIELLVVITVMAILSAIGYGAIVATRNDDQARAAANLVADLVRQARHAAMSSGAPVELRIEEDAGGTWTIAGVRRTVIFSEQFEGNQACAGIDPVTEGNHGLSIADFAAGYAGTGIFAAAAVALELPDEPAAIRTADDGLYLECCVYADPYPGSPKRIFGLALQDAAANVVAAVDLVSTDSDPSGRWAATGYAGEMALQGDSPIEVNGDYDLRSGEWARIGLQIGGDRAVLFQNGRQVGSAAFPGWDPDGLAAPYTVLIGKAGSKGTLDNCRVYRTGAGARTELPANQLPGGDYRLLVLPEGTVTGDTSIVLTTTVGSGSDRRPLPGMRNRATITVGASGKVNIGYEDVSE